MIIWIILATTLVINTIITMNKKDKADMTAEVILCWVGVIVMVWLKRELNIPVTDCDWAFALYLPAHIAGCGIFSEKYHV